MEGNQDFMAKIRENDVAGLFMFLHAKQLFLKLLFKNGSFLPI